MQPKNNLVQHGDSRSIVRKSLTVAESLYAEVAEETLELLGQDKSFICQSQQKIIKWSIKGSWVIIRSAAGV